MSFFKSFVLTYLLSFVLSVFCGVSVSSTDLKRKSVDFVRALEKVFQSKENKYVPDICFALKNNSRWHDDYIKISVWKLDGTRILPINSDLSWKLVKDVELDLFGKSLFGSILKVSEIGGWVSYPMFNGFRHVYVKKVSRGVFDYVLSAGFFSEDPELLCPFLIDYLVRYWRQFDDVSELFQIVSNRYGPFVIGDLYVTVMDENGLCLANGKNDLLVGKNLSKNQGPDRGLIAKILKRIKNKSLSDRYEGWVSSKFGPVSKKMYYKVIKDRSSSKRFLLVSGYLSGVDEKHVLDLAKKAIAELRSEGKKDFIGSLNTKKRVFDDESSEALKEALSIMLTDSKGMVLAYSSIKDKSLIGQNIFFYTDQKKHTPMKFLKKEFERVNTCSWATRFVKGGLERIYGERIKFKNEGLIILIFGYFPHKRVKVAKVLVDDVCAEFKLKGGRFEDLEISEKISPFIRGDIRVFIYDDQGICWFDGENEKNLWTVNPDIKAVFNKLPKYESFTYGGRKYKFKLSKNLFPKFKGSWLVFANY